MSDLYKDIDNDESFTQRYFGLSTLKFFIAFVAVVVVGIYIGTLLFGQNSLEVLMSLESYENNLKVKIKVLKAENAKDQKSYFQLKELAPANNKG